MTSTTAVLEPTETLSLPNDADALLLAIETIDDQIASLGNEMNSLGESIRGAAAAGEANKMVSSTRRYQEIPLELIAARTRRLALVRHEIGIRMEAEKANFAQLSAVTREKLAIKEQAVTEHYGALRVSQASSARIEGMRVKLRQLDADENELIDEATRISTPRGFVGMPRTYPNGS